MTFVAPLKMICVHLIVSNSGADTMTDMLQWIMTTDGWTDLFCGNTDNVLCVTPSKAIEAR
jgi:hypothetical protein